MTNPKNTINSKPSNTKESEEQLQAKCYQWFHNQFPALRGLLFHIPNGGNRSEREGAKFKAIGVVPGIPDLMLCVPLTKPRSVYDVAPKKYSHGLFIELKADKGVLSAKQIKVHEKLKSAGYDVETINSFSDFEELVRNWINDSHLKTLI